MRVGVLGLGRIGTMHARNAAQHPAVERVVLLGRDAGRLARARDGVAAALAPGAPPELAGRLAGSAPPAVLEAATDVAGVLPSLDALVVATSTPTHPDLVRRAVAAGVPALVEKPLALEVDELEALAEELEASGVPVAVAFHRRYDPGFTRLRELVRSGAAGTVRSARATDADRSAISLDYVPTSGGIWRDLVIHHLDLVPWVLGEPAVAVTASGAVLDEPRLAALGDVDTATAVLQMASGAVATIAAARRNGAGQDVRLEVSGSRASFAAGLDDHLPLTSTEPGVAPPASSYEDFVARFEPAFRAEVDHFLRLARGEAEERTPPREGVAALRLAVAAEESARTGAAVRVG